MAKNGPKIQMVVVVVDDDCNQLDLMERLMKEILPELAFVRLDSGKELLEYVDKVVAGLSPYPNLLMIDINMQEVSGFEALEAIRKQKPFEKVPRIVMVSSSIDQKRREMSLKLGANEVLEKPFGLTEWRGAIRAIFEREQILQKGAI